MKPRIAIPVPNSDPEYSTRALPDYVNSVDRRRRRADRDCAQPLQLGSRAACQILRWHSAPRLARRRRSAEVRRGAASRTAAPDAARDNIDELLLQDAHDMRKPILTICYGTQSLNVWRNGTLVQHIESPVQHARTPGAPRSEVIQHAAQVDPDSALAALTGSSDHRQLQPSPVGGHAWATR